VYVSAVCCLDRFYQQYTTTTAFGEYISDGTLPMQTAITKQASCAQLNSPPTNDTQTLLDGTLDFVNGSFARMGRSYSRIDTTPTRGYQDILLFLALEDVRSQAAVDTKLMTLTGYAGDRLRFFVGMAHIKTLRSDRLAVTSSQVEINADITSAYVYTTKTSTDFTFIRDVRVQLREVRRAGAPANASTAKFATITILVPETLTSADAINIIPPLSLQVSVGYTSSMVSDTVYPCTQTYTGAAKTAIDTMLEAQRSCALQDPMCKAQGPVPVDPDGSIQFTFPLAESTWSEASLAENVRLRKSLFIDFMVSATDINGKQLITKLQSSSVLQRTSIMSMCTDVAIVASIEEVLTVDVFLGLVGEDDQYEDTLVQNLDVTRQTVPANMRRDISSRSSNVMTMLIKGDAGRFDEPYAEDYTLAVEDMITLHFLSRDKLAIVQALIDSGDAFRQVRGLDTDLSSVRLEPTDALLLQCPLQAIANRYGCVARREVAQRAVDFQATSIVNIAPNDASDLINVSTRAGIWASNLLGNTEHSRQLGYNHSQIMNARHALNARYRRGFLVSPTTPWRQTEQEQAGVDSAVDLSQITITTMLISLDSNIGKPYVSTVPGGRVRAAASRRLLSGPSTQPAPKRHISRMLLQLNSPVNPKPEPEVDNNAAATITREITSVHDNTNVARAVCTDRPRSHRCSMVRMSKAVPTADFCQTEEQIIAQMHEDIERVVLSASKNAVHAVYITSVAQYNQNSICGPQPRRRLLTAGSELEFTLVLELHEIRDTYVFDNGLLHAASVTAFTQLTNETYFLLCGGPVGTLGPTGVAVSDHECVKALASHYNTTRDIVLHFSLDTGAQRAVDTAKLGETVRAVYGSNARAVVSVPIHVTGESAELHVTITIPFLKTYANDQVVAAKTALVAAGFHLETRIEHDVVLDVNGSGVSNLSSVLQHTDKLLATLYGVPVAKIYSAVRVDSTQAKNGQTHLAMRVKVPWNETTQSSASSLDSVRQGTPEMQDKLEVLLRAAQYQYPDPGTKTPSPPPPATVIVTVDTEDTTPSVLSIALSSLVIILSCGGVLALVGCLCCHLSRNEGIKDWTRYDKVPRSVASEAPHLQHQPQAATHAGNYMSHLHQHPEAAIHAGNNMPQLPLPGTAHPLYSPYQKHTSW